MNSWNSAKRDITILVESKSNWFFKYAEKLKRKLNKKHHVKIITDIRNLNNNNDILFVLSYYKIIKENSLKKSKKNFVVHGSNLPRGRGFSPISWNILKGKKEIFLCLFEIGKNKIVDSGNIFLKKKIIFKGNELINEIRHQISLKIIKMCCNIMSKKISFFGYKQSGKATYFRKRNKLDSELDINKSLKSQFNLMRIADNEKYPLFFNYKNKKFIIKIYDK